MSAQILHDGGGSQAGEAQGERMREREGTPVPGEGQGPPEKGRQRLSGGEAAPPPAPAAGGDSGGIDGKTRAPCLQQGFLDGPAAQGIAGAGDLLAGMKCTRRGRRGSERFQINAQKQPRRPEGQRADDGLRRIGKGQGRLHGGMGKKEAGRAGDGAGQCGGQIRAVGETGKNEQRPGQHAGGSGTGRCKAQNVGFVGGRETGRHALMKLRRLPGRGNRAEKQAERRRREEAVHAGLIP